MLILLKFAANLFVPYCRLTVVASLAQVFQDAAAGQLAPRNGQERAAEIVAEVLILQQPTLLSMDNARARHLGRLHFRNCALDIRMLQRQLVSSSNANP